MKYSTEHWAVFLLIILENILLIFCSTYVIIGVLEGSGTYQLAPINLFQTQSVKLICNKQDHVFVSLWWNVYTNKLTHSRI